LDATACDGKTFIIKAYGNASSTPLTLYSSATAITSVVAATKNQSTALPSGATVSSAATTEILYTITTPTLAAGDIFKLTIEQQS